MASFRARFPQTRSFMMDDETLHRFENRAGDGNSALSAPPPQLEPAEVAAFQRCAEEAKRLEQEHIPHEAVLSALSTW